MRARSIVNGRTVDEHFGNAVHDAELRLPFRVTGTEGRFNAMIKVEGGGVTGQAGAIRHGISRALLELDPEGHRLPLRQAGLLTRDPRMKERKKYGLEEGPQGTPVHQALRRAALERPCVRCRTALGRSRNPRAMARGLRLRLGATRRTPAFA